MNCSDFNYFRAYIERLVAPRYSTCGKCRRPWKFVARHSTKYSQSRGCFSLCESCWKELGTPERRMLYYKRLWLEWQAWGSDVEWDVIKAAVLKEGQH